MDLPTDVLYEIAERSSFEDFINLITTHKVNVDYFTLSRIYNLPPSSSLGELIYYSSLPMYERITYGDFDYIANNIKTFYEMQCVIETTTDEEIASYLADELGDRIYNLSPLALSCLASFDLVNVKTLSPKALAIYYQDDIEELMKINDVFAVLEYLPEEKHLDYLLSRSNTTKYEVISHSEIPPYFVDVIAQLVNLYPSNIDEIKNMELARKIDKEKLIIDSSLFREYVLSRNYDRDVLLRSIDEKDEFVATLLILIDDWELASEILGKTVTSYAHIPIKKDNDGELAILADNVEAFDYFSAHSVCWSYQPRSEKMLLYLISKASKKGLWRFHLEYCVYDYKVVLSLYPSSIEMILLDKIEDLAIVKELIPLCEEEDTYYAFNEAIKKGAIDTAKYLKSIGKRTYLKRDLYIEDVKTLEYLLEIGFTVDMIDSTTDEVISELERRGKIIEEENEDDYFFA